MDENGLRPFGDKGDWRPDRKIFGSSMIFGDDVM
jgi:hypothetical protein